MIRVLLADDHQLMRQGLRRSLEDAGIDVIGEAVDGVEAIRMAAELVPDVVLMDVSMPRLDGIESTRALKLSHPDLPVIILTMHGKGELLADAISAGAVGYLTKDASLSELSGAIEAVARGEILLSSELAGSMLSELSPAPIGTGKAASSPLTRREEEILQHIANGASTTEVSANLFISAKTVKNHLASIYEKLDARDRTQAVLNAVRMGIVRIH